MEDDNSAYGHKALNNSSALCRVAKDIVLFPYPVFNSDINLIERDQMSSL